jgi:cyclophilin family peptidyl-prolyl cis-trans isomerase
LGKNRAHERGLSRARDRRRVQYASQARRERLMRIGVILLVILVSAMMIAILLPEPQRDAPVVDPADDPILEDEPVAGGVACDGEVPPTADEEKPQWDDPPEMVVNETVGYRAKLATSCGTIELELFAADAPMAVNNFVFLAEEGFFDGVVFHRVVPGFVVQGGDPTGTGTGGPGYRFEDELELAEEQGYTAGSLAMANAGPDTNGSQFFIVMEGGGDALQPLYSLFGQVTDGMDAVDRIAAIPLVGERPTETVYIESVTIEETDGPAAGADEPPAAEPDEDADPEQDQE